MPKDYSDQKLYSEEEILDVLIGLDVVYQSKSWIGKRLYWPWHVCLETLAVMLTGNELSKREAVDQVETMLREEGYDEDV
jgi:hypothetical protein